MKKTFKVALLSLCVFPFNFVYAGGYIGLNTGPAMVTFSKKITYNNVTNNASDKYTGLKAQLILGYSSPILVNTLTNEIINLGLEADFDYNWGQSSTSVDPWFLTTKASVNESMKYSYGIYLLPKYTLPEEKVSFFIGPGFSRGWFETSSSYTGGNLGITGNANKWLNGFGMKVGVEAPVTTSANVVLTFQYTHFSSQTWTRLEPLTDEYVTAKYTPVISSLTIGVVVDLDKIGKPSLYS